MKNTHIEDRPSSAAAERGRDQPDAGVQASPSPDEGAGPLDPGRWLGRNSNTLSAIERLRATVDEETEKLEARAAVDFVSFGQRKNRGLLELNRAVRGSPEDAADPRLLPHLTQLRASLARNQAALQIHLDAAREVSAIITRSVQEVESDGTYSLAGTRPCR
ncbi:hypothetical protein ACTZWT_17735 [Rhodopseudomonas sp. NSM]|uniref:hypothetical protein n=1 Tax=Rhodopseudomonas sp. NSM TaxID=3457630 RepID=UPI0040359E68